MRILRSRAALGDLRVWPLPAAALGFGPTLGVSLVLQACVFAIASIPALPAAVPLEVVGAAVVGYLFRGGWIAASLGVTIGGGMLLFIAVRGAPLVDALAFGAVLGFLFFTPFYLFGSAAAAARRVAAGGLSDRLWGEESPRDVVLRVAAGGLILLAEVLVALWWYEAMRSMAI